MKYFKTTTSGHLGSVYQMGLYYEEIYEYIIAKKYYKLAVNNGHILSEYKLKLLELLELLEKKNTLQEELNSKYN